MKRTTGDNMGFASGEVMCKLGALCFYSTLVVNETLRSETRPNAKPQTVGCKCNEPTAKQFNNRKIVKCIYQI